ncbi:AAA family ATPase [Puniceibacterium sediminis]|uniref:Exodeoxyribonuclease V alpha subunit n=1 Tax=Puniceibacterium sediminis TaxID=1608407 RepID=A0A238VZF1_9RHOB|nr:AAA family ATPase [Puniceibacterium sediminis]SNR39725.1 exodeoxyribonuclease V alpha subunit [Puniceibacterium sediminis]
MTQTVVIENILWEGVHGGAVFNAATLSRQRHRFLAGRSVMPRPPVPGEIWKISGKIKDHPDYGSQIVIDKAVLQKPSGNLIISAISKSKLFPGIGPARAGSLWNEFGETIYEMLDLGNVEAFKRIIGIELAKVMVDGWRALSIEADVYRYLDCHGLPMEISHKLIAIYENSVIEKLDENPYRLLAFTTWRQADRVALSIGVDHHDERRLVAAAEAVGYQRLQSSHTVTKRPSFLAHVRRLLGCGDETAERALKLALADHAVVEVAVGLQGVGPAAMERFISERVRAMNCGGEESRQPTLPMNADDGLDTILTTFEAKEKISLNKAQLAAIRMALRAPVSVITGGAGVGKTTVLKAIHEMSERRGGHIHQMALAGRAAKRMTEATSRPAKTIMSFLHAVDTGQIKLGAESTLIIDETSMVDLPMMYRILRRMDPGCRLLLVGDPAQLPPIGFGLVFHALCETESVPHVKLTEVHRQTASTGIPQISAAIRNGIVPSLNKYKGMDVGVSFIDCVMDHIADTVLDVTNDLGGIGDTQIVGAVKNGPAGTKTINDLFHRLLSPARPERLNYAEGEPVIWNVNDYDIGLMNGSLGIVQKATVGLEIEFDGELKTIPDEAIGNIDHAYAITCHKSQGSQFKRVIIPVVRSLILDRTLLYTAITRAQEQVVLVGNRSVFEEAVMSRPNPDRRETGLFSLLEN